MGKFLNKPADAVGESLRGLALCHADTLRLNEHPRFVRRSAPVPGKVALISGGGSGHDPLHAGLVGKGMLDAAVPGEVCSSPSVEQILAAAEAVGGDAGVLCIIKNYAGEPVLELVRGVIDQAAEGGRPVSMCGDVAATPDGLGRLLECGVRSFCVPPRLAAPFKQFIRSADGIGPSAHQGREHGKADAGGGQHARR